VGAFDVLYGRVRCPACATRFYIAAQTKFLVPDFASYSGRELVPGAPQPIDFDPADLLAARVWDDQWVHFREPSPGGGLRVTLLLDLDDLFECHCETPLALLADLSFSAAPAHTVTLEALRALDARAAAAVDAVDFADGEPFARFEGDLARWCADLRALSALAEPERRARLRAVLDARFPRRSAAEREDVAPFTHVQAPMRCAACKEVRDRFAFTFFTHPYLPVSVFGERWTGGVLRPGVVLPVDLGALDDARDHGAYARLRPPAGRGELTFLHAPSSWSCACGAGRAAAWLRFVPVAGGVTLADVEARVVRDADAFHDVDFVEATSITHGLAPPGMWTPPRPALDRAGIIRWLLAEWPPPSPDA
jgi:hypothetical protein